MQTLILRTNDQQALEAVKNFALELGLKFSTFEEYDDYTPEQEIQDIIIAHQRKNDERVSLSEVLSNLKTAHRKDIYE